MKRILFLTLAFLSCTNRPYRGKEVVGADEFVMDSYKIREGKLSILEMEGQPLTFSELKEGHKEGKVELAGRIETPLIAVDGKMRLFEVLAIAKISPKANLFKSYVVRDNQMLPVDLYRLLKEGDMSQNVVMQGGDKIYIADKTDSNIMVMGEVGEQKLLSLPNGFMPLRQALAEAGGLALTGDRRYIQVIRGNLTHPKIYTIHWEHLVRLPTNSLLLMPGDIVYVAATPITEWNRFISQVLPTVIGVDMVTKGAKTAGFIETVE